MTTKTKRRVGFWSGITLLVAVALAIALRPRPVPVDMATVTRGRLVVTLDHEGKTRVLRRFVVSAPVAGRVLRIELQPGDQVVASQTVIATFAPGASPLLDARTRAEAQARVRAAEAVLEQAKAQREQTRVESRHAAEERDRARSLAAIGLMTVEGRQAAEAESAARQQALDAAEAAVQAASHDADAARAALVEPGPRAPRAAGASPTLTLRSPIDGVVLERLHESEADVPQGEPLVTVADTSALEVVADYLSTDAVRIAPGMPVLIDQWGGSEPLHAVVHRVEPSGFTKVSALGVEEQRVYVVIRFEDPAAAWRALGDGYRVEARVVIWQAADVVTVPTSSLFRHGNGWAVFAVDGGVARLRQVGVGQRNDTIAQIVSGLEPGARVIVYPPDNVSDGARVTLR